MAANTPPSGGKNELARIREKLNLKQRQMAEALGIGFDQYRNYEYRKPPDDVLEDAKLMLATEGGPGLSRLRPTRTGKLKILGAIGAGPGPDYARDDWEMPAPVEFLRDDYGGLAVPGDAYSMMPLIHPGDTLVFKTMPVAKLNKIMAVRMPGDTFPIVKKCIYSGGRFLLHSFNPAYEDIDLGQGEVLGMLVGIVSIDMDVKIGPEDSGIDEAYIESKLRSRLF